jgi:hypothetical protein
MISHQEFMDNKNEFWNRRLMSIIEKFNRQQHVELALYFAKDVFYLFDEKDKPKVQQYIDLIQKYLKDPNYFCPKQMQMINLAVSQAWLAWSAANVTKPWAVIWIALKSISETACPATNITWAFNEIRNMIAEQRKPKVNLDHKLQEYLTIANTFFTTTNQTQPFLHLDQKIVYLIDEVEENLIIKQDNIYFLNMNGITNCHHLGCNSQDELIEKIINSNDAFYWFSRRYINRLYP